MIHIVFKGYLEAMYPEGLMVAAESAYEAMAALSQFPGFRREDGKTHDVFLPQFLSEAAVKERTNQSTILVVPVLGGAGGKGGSWFMVAVGCILLFTPLAGYGVSLIGTGLTVSFATIGAMMLLNGVVGLLMPQPSSSTSGTTDETSSYIAGGKNTVKIGTRIPILYGRRKIGGHLLSLNITAGNKNAPVTAAPESDGFLTTVENFIIREN